MKYLVGKEGDGKEECNTYIGIHIGILIDDHWSKIAKQNSSILFKVNTHIDDDIKKYCE